MSENKLGNLSKLSNSKRGQEVEVEIIDPKSKTTSVNKGDIALKVIEVIPNVIGDISSAYQSRQATLQLREETEKARVHASERIVELKSNTEQIVSENNKEIQKLKNEDSRHERESNLLRDQYITESELKLKGMDNEHLSQMKKLELEGHKLNTMVSHIEFLQKTIQSKIEKGEDYSLESKMLAEAIHLLDLEK